LAIGCPLSPKAKVRGSNPLGRATSEYATGAESRRFPDVTG
jgi:hypothetical protein